MSGRSRTSLLPKSSAACRVALVGKLASMSKRDAAQLLRRHGAVVVPQPDPSVNLVVVGEKDLPLLEPTGWTSCSTGPRGEAVDEGSLEVVTETQLWQRLGMVDADRTSSGSTRRPCWPNCWACRWP